VPVAAGSGGVALSQWRDCILAKVLLSCLTIVPCSSDETRIVVSEDTSKKIDDVTPCRASLGWIRREQVTSFFFCLFLFLLLWQVLRAGFLRKNRERELRHVLPGQWYQNDNNKNQNTSHHLIANKDDERSRENNKTT
jgi:hypothetical protein